MVEKEPVKVESNRIVVDCKTGKQTTETYMMVEGEPYVEPKGLDLDKLKQLLVDKELIADKSEVE